MRTRGTFKSLSLLLLIVAFVALRPATGQYGRGGQSRNDSRGNDSRGNDSRGNDSRGNDSRGNDSRGNDSRGNGSSRNGPNGRGPNWRPKPLPSRQDFASWEVPEAFEDDVFTFVRIEYDSYGPFGWWDRWDNDYPDGDWNFSFRLQQLTTLRVDPNGRVLRLTDPDLFDYPFVYMAGAQYLTLNQAERTALRRYLLNGGFLMVDDFWSPEGWATVSREMGAVFPDRVPRELTIEHPVFHTVYDLQELPQVVDIKTWSDGYRYEHRHSSARGDMEPHFWGYFDDHDHLIALLCHNNDLGDGWEREGENEEYFREFSEKWSYPLGINVITYAMTH
jgi:hypothetical protein